MDDITQLQQLLDGGTSVTGSNSSFDIGQLMAWIIIPSLILTVVVCLALVINIFHRWKVDKAIFEIRDTLREMKLTGQLSAKPTPSLAQTPIVDTEPET